MCSVYVTLDIGSIIPNLYPNRHHLSSLIDWVNGSFFVSSVVVVLFSSLLVMMIKILLPIYWYWHFGIHTFVNSHSETVLAVSNDASGAGSWSRNSK